MFRLGWSKTIPTINPDDLFEPSGTSFSKSIWMLKSGLMFSNLSTRFWELPVRIMVQKTTPNDFDRFDFSAERKSIRMSVLWPTHATHGAWNLSPRHFEPFPGPLKRDSRTQYLFFCVQKKLFFCPKFDFDEDFFVKKTKWGNVSNPRYHVGSRLNWYRECEFRGRKFFHDVILNTILPRQDVILYRFWKNMFFSFFLMSWVRESLFKQSSSVIQLLFFDIEYFHLSQMFFLSI